MPSPYKIAIIGAGPAGCTLAHLLLKANMDVTIFEGEATSKARTQGGSLDLHTDTGIAALKECGLYEEFEKHVRYDGEATVLSDKKSNRYVNTGGATSKKDSSGRPEIDRTRLRDLLADPLTDSGTIRWGQHLERVDADGTLHFTTGSVGGFDLVVGADGAWSKVRKLLADEMPAYTGVGGFDAKIPNAEEERPWIHKIVRKGMWMALGDCKSVSCQQNGDGVITASFWAVAPEDWAKTYDLSNPSAIRAALHHQYRDWAAEYHAVIDAVDPSTFTLRNFYQLPIGWTWENRPGFTIIGDAAHLMSPFAGEGVNCAMKDASELAKAISKAAAAGAEGRDGLAPYVSTFEKAMSARLAPIQRSTWLNVEDMYMNPAAPHATIEKFLIRNIVEEVGWAARIPVTIIAYTYFFFAKWRMV